MRGGAWNAWVAGTRYSSGRVNQLFRGKDEVREKSSYELCALDGGDISVFAVTFVRK